MTTASIQPISTFQGMPPGQVNPFGTAYPQQISSTTAPSTVATAIFDTRNAQFAGISWSGNESRQPPLHRVEYAPN